MNNLSHGAKHPPVTFLYAEGHQTGDEKGVKKKCWDLRCF